MKKFALITYEKYSCSEDTNLFSKFINKIKFGIFLMIKTIEIDKEVVAYIIYLKESSRDKTLELKFQKAIDYLKSQNVSFIGVNKEILKRIKSDCLTIVKNAGLVLVSGQKVKAALLAGNLQKLLKSSGIDISKIDAAVISSGDFEFDLLYIYSICADVKYINYICKKNANITRTLDDIYNNFGCCVQISEKVNKGIGESDLILNLSRDEDIFDAIALKSNTLLFNAYSKGKLINSGTKIIYDIDIALSETLNIQDKFNIEDKYLLSEAYIFSKTEIPLYQNLGFENDMLKDIYKCFKKDRFRIVGLDGINI